MTFSLNIVGITLLATPDEQPELKSYYIVPKCYTDCQGDLPMFCFQ